MQENVRRLVILTRQNPDAKQAADKRPAELFPRDSNRNIEAVISESGDSDDAIRLELAEGDFAALKRILACLAGDDPGQTAAPDESAGRRVAEIMFNMRQARAQIFPASMFNEPAWDMLMALYVAHEVSAAADLARWTHTPLTTAMRWIEYLESHKLIVRESSPADRRAHMIRLTDQGRANMDALFADLVEQWP